MTHLGLNRTRRRPLVVPAWIGVDNLVRRLAVDGDAVLLVVPLLVVGAREAHAVVVDAASRWKRRRREQPRVSALDARLAGGQAVPPARRRTP
eukprot:702546-Prymnesium_polylepis.2